MLGKKIEISKSTIPRTQQVFPNKWSNPPADQLLIFKPGKTQM